MISSSKESFNNSLKNMDSLTTGSENLFKKLSNSCAAIIKTLKHIFMEETLLQWSKIVKMLKYQNRKSSYSLNKSSQSFIHLKEWWNKDLNFSVKKFSTVTFQRRDILKKTNRKTYQLLTSVKHLLSQFIRTLTLLLCKIK